MPTRLALVVVAVFNFSNSAHVVDYDRHLLVLTAGLNVGVTRKIRLSRSAEHSAHRKTSSLSSPGKLPKFARKWQKNTPTTGFPEGSVQFNLAGAICVLCIFPSFSMFALEIHLNTFVEGRVSMKFKFLVHSSSSK